MANFDKIYRSNKDYMIGGVCGGLAEHFEIDPTIVRLIFIILSFGGGSGVIIYLILWLVLPKEPSKKEKPLSFEDEREAEGDIKTRLEDYNTRENRGSFLGVLILLVGLVALLNQIQPALIRWEIFWPLLLILSGLYLIFRKR